MQFIFLYQFSAHAATETNTRQRPLLLLDAERRSYRRMCRLLDGELVDVLIFIETNLSCAALAAIFSCSDPAEPAMAIVRFL
jgi:hypothetical protein